MRIPEKVPEGPPAAPGSGATAVGAVKRGERGLLSIPFMAIQPMA